MELTFIISMLSVVRELLFGLELVEAKVRYLDHPATVHQAVGGLEVAMGDDGAVYVDHTLG